MITCPGHGHNLDIFHADPAACPEVSITTNALMADLVRQQATHARLVGEASALGTKPEARAAWELVHEWAGIVAKTESRLQQQRWAA